MSIAPEIDDGPGRSELALLLARDPNWGIYVTEPRSYARIMAKQRANGNDIVKMWLIAAFVVGCCIWLLNNSTVDCNYGPGGFGGGKCVATSMAHGLAPYLPWAIAFMVGLTLIATLRFLTRRR